MNLTAFLAFTGCAALTAVSAIAQEATLSGGKRVAEVTWTQAGTYQWSRPPHVRYVLVRACGGGGGGGGGFSLMPRPVPQDDGGTAAGGGGGAGATVVTTLLGPLAAESYTIVVGSGGAGGASKSAQGSSGANALGTRGNPGTPTSFAGTDISFETPGAPGGSAGQTQTRISADGNFYEYFVTRVGSSGGAFPGGGSAQDGARGLLGLGGQGSVQGYSGGGGGSLGRGGAGGNPDGGGDDGGTCAGGGGAAFPRSNSASAAGGDGGAGSLTLLSIASPAD